MKKIKFDESKDRLEKVLFNRLKELKKIIRRCYLYLAIKIKRFKELYKEIDTEIRFLFDSSLRKKRLVIPVKEVDFDLVPAKVTQRKLLINCLEDLLVEIPSYIFYQWDKVDKNGNLIIARKYYQKTVQLSVLKNNNQAVDQSKLEKFYYWFGQVLNIINGLKDDFHCLAYFNSPRGIYLDQKLEDSLFINENSLEIDLVLEKEKPKYKTNRVLICKKRKFYWRAKNVEVGCSSLLLNELIGKLKKVDEILAKENQLIQEILEKGRKILKKLKKENRSLKVLKKLLAK